MREDRPWLRAAFVGADAAPLARLFGGDDDLRYRYARCTPGKLDGGAWAAGVDVVILAATHQKCGPALQHAAAAGAAAVVIVSADDDNELSLREQCVAAGLDGDDAAVLRRGRDAGRALVDLVDAVAKPPPPGQSVFGGVLNGNIP